MSELTYIPLNSQLTSITSDGEALPKPTLSNILRSVSMRKWMLFILLISLILLLALLNLNPGPRSVIEAQKTIQIQYDEEESNLANLSSKDVLSYEERLVHLNTYFPIIDLPSQEPRILILTFFSPDPDSQALKNLTFSNFLSYGRRHNYTVIDGLTEPSLRQIYQESMKTYDVPHYFKFKALLYFLPHFDWIFWADGDSIFLNQSILLSQYTNPDYDLILTTNPRVEGYSWSMINNSGHFLLRNSEWSKKFLKDCIYMSTHSCQDFIHMIPASYLHYPRDDGKPSLVLNNWIELCGKNGGYWLSDQGIIQWLVYFKDESYRCHVQFRGFRDFNSEFPWYSSGDFILHFPGKSLAQRKHLIPLFLENTDPMTGEVSTHGHSEMNSESNLANKKNMYFSDYEPMNIPCFVYRSILKRRKKAKQFQLY